jgi:hypothetical protein
VDAKQLPDGALVAVMNPEARDHLRDGQPGPVATRLEPNEPIADSGQGRQQDAVGDRYVTDPEAACQGRLCQRFLS